MFAGFGAAEETNARYRYLLDHGETGLSVAFDMPTLMGYDTDDAWGLGEFGKCGVAVSSLADMELLFAGHPPRPDHHQHDHQLPRPRDLGHVHRRRREARHPPSRAGRHPPERHPQGVHRPERVRLPARASMRLVTDTIEFATASCRSGTASSISGYHIREAGATAVQELAFTLADGIAYVEWALARGLPSTASRPASRSSSTPTTTSSRRSASTERPDGSGQGDARAVRRKNPLVVAALPHADGGGVAHGAAAGGEPDPHDAAGVGGGLGRHADPAHQLWDEAMALPSEKAVRLAVRTQQVLLHESGVANTVDPLGGSYFVEQLTSQMERECWAYFDRIEALGGVLAAVEAGFFQREISRLVVPLPAGDRRAQRA